MPSKEPLPLVGTAEQAAPHGSVTVGGTADAPTFDLGGGAANNLCGNIPTANATVFVIDTVLLPAS